MKNLVKDIEQNCHDKSVQGIVDFLVERGDIGYISNYHREIWFFYKGLRDASSDHKEARSITIDHFDLTPSTFKRIIRRFRPEGVVKYVPKAH